MTRYRDRYEIGARVRTTRASANFFAKGQHGTVIASSGDGNYRVRFDRGDAWWLNEAEFKRIPERRASYVERLALAWHRILRGSRA
ncbi:hypothetical protein [Pseudoxanthomonas wuyuanensis]|uniref:Uncharacterized protein n=1 Tax=Pseudoxanthomonas wuyuanensis TaxID=1073196 RepID=A0A286D4Q3_9GAMM|nr:hypothetical protein [Pseudoxanthomonas wuyuanensis]KAF1719787.1 hypothetical protein CSC75_13955 [Pseudoxanthomonas wuyuanensis]SOD53629.1 hypothetical protein SAMN06296416_102508 [Pseudoxanthomonas wuyuanensis]